MYDADLYAAAEAHYTPSPEQLHAQEAMRHDELLSYAEDLGELLVPCPCSPTWRLEHWCSRCACSGWLTQDMATPAEVAAAAAVARAEHCDDCDDPIDGCEIHGEAV